MGRCRPPGLRSFADAVNMLTSWDKVTANPAGIGSALLDRLPEMLAAQSLAREVTPGDALVHWDARTDNVLIRAGQAVLLDWAWASRGAPWLDSLLLAMDFRIQGGPDADDFLRAQAITRDVEPGQLRSVVACMVGVWAERAPPPIAPGAADDPRLAGTLPRPRVALGRRRGLVELTGPVP